ncbi:microvitellogenin-like [Manduca sexta]|uniref:Uncharacterized protein n=1 Tax=Manduca sexta TaxID=7130 RepID=A0A921ZDY2_MANSE|nr:microvitellogenin-like [Manduca sexta]XP_037297808.1 microvitellogenin-like [Manduca sexta]KAG6455169.1 hypothetical protein O3G_MSEX009073 [Manduca sexta]KAG6455170.1 hypothetical protein O3G_MSEX009073 [Manduca sexta]
MMDKWEAADRPNYMTNVNMKYPYSELPYYGDYYLLRIPIASQVVEHVDYWGEGWIKTDLGISGFPKCYNVNCQYQCVSNGPDKGCKIPNRIPVFDENSCDTSNYIKNHSIKLVTLMGAPIIEACARDIARIVDPAVGSVVVFGFEFWINLPDIQRLRSELSEISMFYCPKYELPDYLKGLTLFDTHIAFLNATEIENQLYNALIVWNIDTAIEITQSLNESGGGSVITNLVDKLLEQDIESTMSFVYKLWLSGETEIVKKYFPVAFKLICNEDKIEIVSNYFGNTKLKLDTNTDEWNNRLAWGDKSGNTGKTYSWTMVPIWKDNKIIFQMKNNEYDMLLRLDIHDNYNGDRKGWGSKNVDEVRYNWKLYPRKLQDDVVFFIVNCQYDEALKLDPTEDRNRGRQLWGHNGMYLDKPEYFGWLVRSN